MSGTVNKAIILGYVGKEPDIKRTDGGFIIANFSLATTETSGSKAKGNVEKYTEWHRIVAFGKLAEIIEKYVHKGDKLYVEGKFQTKKWQDKNGQDRQMTEIIADKMQIIASKNYQEPQPEVKPSSLAPIPSSFVDDDIPF